LLLTPEYKRRAEGAAGGVFKEFEIIRNRYNDPDDDFLVLCVLFEGSQSNSIPAVFLDDIYRDFTSCQPRLNEVTKKYYMLDKFREEYIPKFMEIARAIETKISVRSSQDNETYERLLESLFAQTKITRKWIKLHPEFINHLFVSTRSYDRIKSQDAVFLIGRKGSGKSTVANTLPELEHERYKTCIPILADHINLLSAFEFINYDKLIASFHSIRDYSGGQASEYIKLNPVQFLFKYAWLGLLYICLAKELTVLGKEGGFNAEQLLYKDSLEKEFSEFTFSQSKNVEASRYFTLSSVSFLEFWDEQVSEALKLDRFSDVIRYLDSNVNEENYLEHLLPGSLLSVIRTIVRLCDRYALVTLDDFDSAFSIFRESLRSSSNNVASQEESKSLESSWVQSLMMLILELKGYRKGWRDAVFDKLDFCITIPRDSYTQVVNTDRDAYLDIECTADLDWTGVYLAQMLSRRLCYINSEDVNEREDVFFEINRVLRAFVKKLPLTLTFAFNKERVTIDLFCYVLRHTFWRPRDILTYYAALLTAAQSCPDQDELTVDQVRRIVGAKTKNIINTEFLIEFAGVISNLQKIINEFRKSNQVLTYSELFEKLTRIDFNVVPQGLVTEFHDKLRILYEIGFLGVDLPQEVAEAEGLNTTQCFYFNEGSSILATMELYSFDDCNFIIHPIFVEYLHINHKENTFILNWTVDYLRDNHVVRVSSIDVY
jgi:energy-coupling factor transporter ATP-binding protein EcfA2